MKISICFSLDCDGEGEQPERQQVGGRKDLERRKSGSANNQVWDDKS